MVDKNFWKSKRILITGHTGFKGSWLCMLLNSLGADISGYALDPPTNPSLFELCNINSIVKSTIGDICDFEKLLDKIEKEKPEIVIHMAAQPLVRLSYSEPVYTYRTNIMGTINVLESLRISKTKSARVLINVTTDKCYENKEWLQPYKESDRLGGYDPYSNSKACSELVTSAYRSSFFNSDKYDIHNLAIATARAGNVIGGGDWAKDRLIPDILISAIEGKPVIIRNPESIRPWQHVLEPLTGYLMLAERLYNEGSSFAEPWNFGPNEDDAKTVRWIVEKFCNDWGENASYQLDKRSHNHEAAYLKLECSKAKNRLNWKPQWNLNKAIDSIIDFTREYSKGGDLKKLCYNQISEYLTSSV